MAGPLVTVAMIALAPPISWSARGGIGGVAVDVVVGTEGARERLLVAAAIDGDGAEALAGGELDAEMAEAADAVDGDQIAGAGAAVADGVEGGDAGAEERGGGDGVHILRHVREGGGEGQHVGGVAAVACDAGGALNVLAGEGLAAAAMAAIAA